MNYNYTLLAVIFALFMSCTKDRDITIDSDSDSSSQNEDSSSNDTEDNDVITSLLTYWSFNEDLENPDIGTGSWIYKGSEYDDTDGSEINLIDGYEAGNCLRLRNPSGDFILSLPTTDYQNIIVKYAATRTSSGSATHEIYYSTDGSTYTQDELKTSKFTLSEGKESSDYETISLDFSDITTVNNNSNFKIKIVFDDDSSSADSGNDRIDNFTVYGSSVPN